MSALAGPSSAFLAAANSGSTASSWQTIVRQRLEERDGRERAYDEMIDDYQRLARYAKQQRDRSVSLLAAASTTTKSSSLPTPSVAATAAGSKRSNNASSASTSTTATRTPSPRTASATTDADSNSAAVKQAYITSMESQLQTMRDELATLYKTQSQNAQRLLVLNEQMRTRDDKERDAADETRQAIDELSRLRRKEEDLRSVVGEKDKMIQIMQDELSALSLELSQVEMRNDDLKRDNASLLQRWLDRMNEEAEKMNDGNRFLQEVDRRRVSGSATSATDDAETTVTTTTEAGSSHNGKQKA